LLLLVVGPIPDQPHEPLVQDGWIFLLFQPLIFEEVATSGEDLLNLYWMFGD
jgi:hypothetical protein